MQIVTDPATLKRWREGCQAYANADRSDPFALRRALTHLRTGVVSYYEDRNHDWVEASYYATRSVEKHTTPSGQTYMVTVWHNMRRP